MKDNGDIFKNDHLGTRGILNKSNTPVEQVVRSDKADLYIIINLQCDEDGPITVDKELMGNGEKLTEVAPCMEELSSQGTTIET